MERGKSTRGGIYFQELIDNFEKTFNGKRSFNKKTKEGFYKLLDSENKPIYTFRTYEKDGKEYFKSFYGHERGEKKTKKIVAGLQTSHRLVSDLVRINPQQQYNISQNPENASDMDGVRHSIAPEEEFERVGEGGFRRADPRKVELWAKYIVKIANSTYINPDAAAALLMDQGIRVDNQDELTLLKACNMDW